MNQQQAQDLLQVTQQNDYTWQAVLPELTNDVANGAFRDRGHHQLAEGI